MFKKLIVIIFLISGAGLAYAVNTNIDLNDRWVWNDAIGWIDFRQDGVIIRAAKIEGSAKISATSEWLSLDCATYPGGGVCNNPPATGNWFVSNDGNGNFKGWAWADSIGWVSFCGGQGSPDCPGTDIAYQVKATPPADSQGRRTLTGYAWNDAVGWISFNCDQTASGGSNTCSSSGISYRVKTYWPSENIEASGSLTSNTVDTCPSGEPICASGAAYNYILWRGLPLDSGSTVKFQLATSNCENGETNAPICSIGGWGEGTADGAFLGPNGTTADTDKYSAGPNIPMPISNIYHNNKRYYRYKVYLEKGISSSSSPVVEDVIVNWSR